MKLRGNCTGEVEVTINGIEYSADYYYEGIDDVDAGNYENPPTTERENIYVELSNVCIEGAQVDIRTIPNEAVKLLKEYAMEDGERKDIDYCID